MVTLSKSAPASSSPGGRVGGLERGMIESFRVKRSGHRERCCTSPWQRDRKTRAIVVPACRKPREQRVLRVSALAALILSLLVSRSAESDTSPTDPLPAAFEHAIAGGVKVNQILPAPPASFSPPATPS